MEADSLKRVQEFFAKDRFATDNGAVIEEIGEHYAKCRMKLGEGHRNAVGAGWEASVLPLRTLPLRLPRIGRRRAWYL